jgi:solute carrier family 35 (adenosine 3'-phospho 5'-phosphosulfate transporter), member B3
MRTGRLVLLSGGVFVLYVAHDALQEVVFMREGFDFGWTMTLFELLSYALFSAAISAAKRTPPPPPVLKEAKPMPFKLYLALVAALALTQGFGSAAHSYGNYPVKLPPPPPPLKLTNGKVVFKSLKLIPTMAMNALALNQKHPPLHFAAAAALSAGAAIFLLADAASPKFNLRGILFLIIAQQGDAATANLQDHLLRGHKRPLNELIFLSNGAAALAVFALVLRTGELRAAAAFFWQDFGALGLLVVQAITAYFGGVFYLALVSEFGSAVAVGVTTVRKCVTILLSLLLINQTASPLHAVGGAAMAAGMVLAHVAERGGGVEKKKKA